MKISTFKRLRLMPAIALAITVIYGCGGDGTPATSADPTAFTLSGVAATGTPFTGATITLTDSTGIVVGTPVIVGVDGKYSYLVPKDAKPPFVLTAKRDDQALYTPVTSRTTATANITPLTNLIAVALSPTGDSSALGAQIAASQVVITSDSVAVAVKKLLDALAPLRSNAGDSIDPISGSFAPDGTGHDRVLDSLNISIVKTGSGANISIGVKAAVADGVQPPSIMYTNSTTPPVLPSSVATAALPATDTGSLLTDLMSRLTACYALPLTQRASGSSVTASQCNSLFKGGAATNYLNNGVAVGPTGAFSGIFGAGGTGVVFDRPVLLATSSTGELLISYRATGTTGSSSVGTLTIIKEGGKLVVAGNQYQYSATVNPWAEDRESLNSPDANYLSTGYNVVVGNAITGGVSVFDRAEVTTPSGSLLVFRPRAGLSYLAIQRPDNTLSNTSVIRLAGRFSASTTTGIPRNRESSVYWAPDPRGAASDWTDTDLLGVNTFGTWKVAFFNAGNTGTTPDTTQYVKTFSRAYTLAELTQQKWAQLTADAKTQLTAQSSAAGGVVLTAGSAIDFSATGGADAWTVPAGAFAPISLSAFGTQSTTNATRWNDTVSVDSSARKATFSCTTQSSGDAHCASGGYAAGVVMNQLQLTRNDDQGVTHTKTINLFRVP